MNYLNNCMIEFNCTFFDLPVFEDSLIFKNKIILTILYPFIFWFENSANISNMVESTKYQDKK